MKTLILGCLLTAIAFPQTTVPAAIDFYRLDYAVKELDGGKVVSSRAYSTVATTDGVRTEIRMGDRVPVPTKDSFTYLDVGVSITSGIHTTKDDHMAVSVEADISSIASNTPGAGPLLRSARWKAQVKVPLRKATTIFSSDATSDKKQMQLELTVTPIL